MIVFSNPVYLWFFLFVPILIFLHYISLGFTKRKALKFANFPAIERVTGGEILSRNTGLLMLRVIILIFVVLGIAGMTLFYIGQASDADFVIGIDASFSMDSDDFRPTRLEAAKLEAKKFLDTLPPEVKIGLINFAGASRIEQELTDDRIQLKASIDAIKTRSGGTDLGEAIITGANLLLKSSRSRVLVLMTDGQVNVGTPLPEAIDYANKNLVTIYPIGIGTLEGGVFPGLVNVTSVLGEETLKAIAINSGGELYKAENKSALSDAYKKIAGLTRKKTSRSLRGPFLLFAVILLITEWILVNTKYRTLP